jgi:hypothetical protein
VVDYFAYFYLRIVTFLPGSRDLPTRGALPLARKYAAGME